MLPKKIYKGVSLQFVETLPEYPASSGYSLHYTLINSENKIVLNSSTNDDDFVFAILGTEQNAWNIGNYTYQKYLKKDGTSPILLEMGEVALLPFFEAENTYDPRTFNKKMLDALENALQKRATSIELEYSFRGKSIKGMGYEELIKARNHFADEVAKEVQDEQFNTTGATKGRIFIGFDG